MKNIAFRFSKYHFPNAFLEHPSFSKSDCFFTSQNSSAGQACIVNMVKRRLAFPFSSFPFPVYSHYLSPSFFICKVKYFGFLILFSILCSFMGWFSLFMGWCVWSLLKEDEIVSPPRDFSGSQIQLLSSSSMLYLSHSLLPAMLCSLWSIFGEKMTCSGKKSFQTAKPENRNFLGIREGSAELAATPKITVLAQSKSKSEGLCTSCYGQGKNCRKSFFNLCI